MWTHCWMMLPLNFLDSNSLKFGSDLKGDSVVINYFTLLFQNNNFYYVILVPFILIRRVYLNPCFTSKFQIWISAYYLAIGTTIILPYGEHY